MKRREFLKAPALGLALAENPGSLRNTWRGFDGPDAILPQDVQQKMHPDFITFVPGIEYFFLGNGDISAVVQYSPRDPQTTFLGFTFMNPERFCRKWSTFLYHPERGLSATKLGVTIEGREGGIDAKTGMYAGIRGYTVTPENLKSVEWKYTDGLPIVSVRWLAGECEVEEEFFVPNEGSVVFRRIIVKNNSSQELKVTLGLSLYANFGLFDEIGTDEKEKTAHAYGVEKMKLHGLGKNTTVAGRYDVRIDLGMMKSGARKEGVYAYSIRDGEKVLKRKNFEQIWKESAGWWSLRSKLETGNVMIDRFARASMSGMKAVVARSGKMDAAPWMYNMEWVSDQALAIEALLHSGMFEEAKVMAERNLRSTIGPDGRTIESSRWFGFDYTELNQNGMLLYALWTYLCWTGDEALLKKYWNKIELCAEFPLRKEFRGSAPHLMKNKREFWERSDIHGVEDGYEMVYQFWVSFGLEKASAIARVLGEKGKAQEWLRTSQEIKGTMLNDPAYRLVEDGHLIKRRTAAGLWQRCFTPPDRKRMPVGSPLAVEECPSPEPDTVETYPIIYGFVDPKSDLAKKTLAWVEQIWSHRYEGGGYPRYNTTSEDNPAAPWPLASLLVARAYAEAGDDDKVWRVLNWLEGIHGGKAVSWFERYGQSLTPPHPPVNVINWCWYEILALFILNMIGFRPQDDHLSIRPRLLSGLNEVKSVLKVRNSTVSVLLHRSQEQSRAALNGRPLEIKEGSVKVPYPLPGKSTIEIFVS